MSIGLNYTHKHVAGGILLPNYVYLLDNAYPLSSKKLFSADEQETKKFLGYLEQGALQDMLTDSKNDQVFEALGTRNILLQAYDYEVRMKCLGEMIHNDIDTNKALITLFDDFFSISYHDIIQNYIDTNANAACKDFLSMENSVYTNCDEAVAQFMEFIHALLCSEGAVEEAEHICKYVTNNLHISYVEGISGVTVERAGSVYIHVGNNTYITLFHELVHFVNRYFRYHYLNNSDVCFDNYTRTNEGLSNFVAYHCLEAIVEKDIAKIEHLPTKTLFFSAYIDVYAELSKNGSNSRKHNFSLIQDVMYRFEGDLLTLEKLDFYIQRFYKFFHYDQHTYFYPKELMYHMGYHEIREMFCKSTNKIQLLTQCLLGKICL